MTQDHATFAMGCFWQPDEFFRTVPGVLATEVGYTGGTTKNPTYEQVCSGRTGHAEAVRLTFDPDQVSYAQLLDLFWNNHNPTTLNRQGPDVGTQYRSGIYAQDQEQLKAALDSKAQVAKEELWGPAPLTTEIALAKDWWPAETYHQKYLQLRGITQCHLPQAPHKKKV
jgi:peptide-methionine (S)-S-oxide reductase